MVPKLNEYVLMEIFRAATPLEWIQISQVCTEWKEIVSKLMKKHNRMSLTDAEDHLWKCSEYQPISAEIAKKLILYAAPFTEDLELEVCVTNATKYCIKIDQFWYLVKDSNINEIIKILAENTSEITCIELNEVANYKFSDLEPFKNMFKRNKIKTVVADDTYSLRTLSENDLIQEITELTWIICEKDDAPENIQHFGLLHNCPNLQKLNVYGYGTLFEVAQLVFYDLQYCKNLKSFKLAEYGDEPLPQACPTSVLINTIGTTLPHLEELAFCSNCIDINFELAQMMALNFTNLRSFTIWNRNLCNSAMSWYMSIPQLKKLHTLLDPSFSPTNFPKSTHLSECYILLDKEAVPSTYTAIIRLFQKMPNLRKFGFTESYNMDRCYDSCDNQKPFGCHPIHDVIFQFIMFAVSEYQTVVITVEAKFRTSFSRKIKIERNSTTFSSKEKESLDFSFILHFLFVKSFMKKLTEYCKQNLKGHALQLIPKRRRDVLIRQWVNPSF